MKLSKVALIGLLFVVARVQAQDALPASNDTPVVQINDINSFDTTLDNTDKPTQGEVAAAAAVDAGATEYQAAEIADAIDNEGASAASASIDAGLTNSQAAEVITEVVTASEDIPSQGEVAADAAADVGATDAQVEEIKDAIDSGASAASAALDAGLSDAQTAEVIDQVTTASDEIADPADVA
ncbi:hypothetical protein DYB38_008674, partial [Aphanomyces astaci]